jgi:hypothetical protein
VGPGGEGGKEDEIEIEREWLNEIRERERERERRRRRGVTKIV